MNNILGIILAFAVPLLGMLIAFIADNIADKLDF